MALLMWLVLLAQGAVCILLTEPYPAFAFPSFGLKGQNAEDAPKPVREEIWIKAVSATDTVNLSQSSYMRHLSRPTYRAMCRKLTRRHGLNLAKKDARITTRILHQQLLKAEPHEVEELKNWIAHEYHFVPDKLVMETVADPVMDESKNQRASTSTKVTVLEIFK